MNIHTKILCGILLLLFPLICVANEPALNKRSQRIEKKADWSFIRGDYDKAMRLYTRAEKRLSDGTDQKLKLALKMARLYIILQSPEEAILYYDKVQQASLTMLSINDICFYIDALRQNGQSQRAEIVARRFAFLAPYSRNQRYLNTLHSLSNLQRYYGKGDSDYSVRLWKNSQEIPEYWLGEYNGEAFYAVSHSRIQDPLKIFYHQTQYFGLTSEKHMPFKSIPRELQSGSVAFSTDNTLMVATGISYNNSDKIDHVEAYQGLFKVQLYYSLIDHKSGGWKRFEPLFEFQEQGNYAHPAFYNNGKSLVFSSDRAGGYGGMDLYIAHWNEEIGKWGEPMNMGPSVNTEGDEIYPRIIDDGLYFASNGLEGYGGYDIYRVSFGRNIVLPGSIFHYPYPINTANNDFGLFFSGDTGFFISDRRGVKGKDDIYTFDASSSPLNSGSVVGVSDEYSAMAGNLNLIKGLKSSNTTTFEKEILITPTYRVPDLGEVVLSLYFDFNHHLLNQDAMAQLDSLLNNPALDDVSELSILGYADEFGSQKYNARLSMQRANAVAEYMLCSGKSVPRLFPQGRGQLALPPEVYKNAAKEMKKNVLPHSDTQIKGNLPDFLSFDELVKLNSRLRRVDIIVKKK